MLPVLEFLDCGRVDVEASVWVHEIDWMMASRDTRGVRGYGGRVHAAVRS